MINEILRDGLACSRNASGKSHGVLTICVVCGVEIPPTDRETYGVPKRSWKRTRALENIMGKLVQRGEGSAERGDKLVIPRLGIL